MYIIIQDDLLEKKHSSQLLSNNSDSPSFSFCGTYIYIYLNIIFVIIIHNKEHIWIINQNLCEVYKTFSYEILSWAWVYQFHCEMVF